MSSSQFQSPTSLRPEFFDFMSESGVTHKAPAMTKASSTMTSSSRRTPFYLLSRSSGPRHIALELRPGTTDRLQVAPQRDDESTTVIHQLWYQDVSGVLRSMANDHAIQCKGVGQCVSVARYTGESFQNWRIDNNRIVNDAFIGRCIAINDGGSGSKVELSLMPCNSSKTTQLWITEFV